MEHKMSRAQEYAKTFMERFRAGLIGSPYVDQRLGRNIVQKEDLAVEPMKQPEDNEMSKKDSMDEGTTKEDMKKEMKDRNSGQSSFNFRYF